MNPQNTKNNFCFPDDIKALLRESKNTSVLTRFKI